MPITNVSFMTYNLPYLRYICCSAVMKGTDSTDDDTVHTLRYYYMELSFCAVMLSLFHAFGDHEIENENENEHDGEDGEENNDNENNGTQGKTTCEKHGNSSVKSTVLL